MAVYEALRVAGFDTAAHSGRCLRKTASRESARPLAAKAQVIRAFRHSAPPSVQQLVLNKGRIRAFRSILQAGHDTLVWRQLKA